MNKYIKLINKQKGVIVKMNREFLLRQLQELQADFEDLTNEEIIECRKSILKRINICLAELGECDEDNI